MSELENYLLKMNNIYDEAIENIKNEHLEFPKRDYLQLLGNNNEKIKSYNVSIYTSNCYLPNVDDNKKAFNFLIVRHYEFINLVLSY